MFMICICTPLTQDDSYFNKEKDLTFKASQDKRRVKKISMKLVRAQVMMRMMIKGPHSW